MFGFLTFTVSPLYLSNLFSLYFLSAYPELGNYIIGPIANMNIPLVVESYLIWFPKPILDTVNTKMIFPWVDAAWRIERFVLFRLFSTKITVHCQITVPLLYFWIWFILLTYWCSASRVSICIPKSNACLQLLRDELIWWVSFTVNISRLTSRL